MSFKKTYIQIHFIRPAGFRIQNMNNNFYLIITNSGYRLQNIIFDFLRNIYRIYTKQQNYKIIFTECCALISVSQNILNETIYYLPLLGERKRLILGRVFTGWKQTSYSCDFISKWLATQRVTTFVQTWHAYIEFP